nr:MAG TPA: Protein of unknown function (DUF3789) [Caudoviricetes sp.]
MIGCIISFIAGGFAGALVMALCATSKNSNINIDLEDTGENVSEIKDVNDESKADCENCEPEHCKEDCCRNCYHSDGVFCGEYEGYISKGYDSCNHYETRAWEEEE